MTIDNVVDGDQATAAWANSVADELNAAPRGVVAAATLTSSGSANSGTATVLSAPAFTAVSGRRYKVTVSFSEGTQSGSGASNLLIADDTTQIKSLRVANASGGSIGGEISVLVVPGAGSKTYRLRTSTSATTFQVVASSASPAEIIVEDVGLA